MPTPTMKTYAAMLHGDRLEWTGESPSTPDPSAPIPVTVSVPLPEPVETPEQAAERRAKMKAALEELARLNPFREITDPVAWVREIRKDRPLPGREVDEDDQGE